MSVNTTIVCVLIGDIGKAPDAVNDTLPPVGAEEEELGATGGEEEEDVTEMQARLEALRS